MAVTRSIQGSRAGQPQYRRPLSRSDGHRAQANQAAKVLLGYASPFSLHARDIFRGTTHIYRLENGDQATGPAALVQRMQELLRDEAPFPKDQNPLPHALRSAAGTERDGHRGSGQRRNGSRGPAACSTISRKSPNSHNRRSAPKIWRPWERFPLAWSTISKTPLPPSPAMAEMLIKTVPTTPPSASMPKKSSSKPSPWRAS